MKYFDWSYGGEPYKMGSCSQNNWYINYAPTGVALTALTSSVQHQMNDDTWGSCSPGSLQNPDVNGHSVYWISGKNPFNYWMKYEIEVVITNQTSGHVKMWEDGVQKINYAGRTDAWTLGNRSIAVGGYSRDYGPNHWRYFADVYLDYALQRVVLADNSNLASATVIENQIPTSWNSTAISATINLGKFTSGTAYLFVYDATGTPNANGYPVTIAGGGTTYTVTPTAGSNGGISPNTPQTVNSGSTTQFTVTPNSGYTAIVGGTCGGSINGNTYTTNAITANCTVSATFADQTAPTTPASLTATAASTTQINLSWAASTDGAGIVGYNVERCAGAACTSWVEIQSTSGAGTTYNNTGLTADTTYRYRVRARDATPNYSGYSPIASATTTITYTVTGTAGSNGTISPASQAVNGGSAATLTVTPNAGYTASASGCGGSLAGTTYTTGAVNANCTVTATFADTTAPTVAITAPTAGAYVAGASVAVTASASDNSDTVAGVQFKSDGANLGAEDTATPFAITWDTTTASEGAHSLTATARDAAGNSATSAGVTVTVDNVAPAASNPLPNGTLMVGTTGVTLRTTTSENADCRYSATSGFTWGAGTPYSTTGGTAHSSALTIAGGRNYRYYSRCLDPAGNPSNTVVSAFFVPRKPMHKVW